MSIHYSLMNILLSFASITPSTSHIRILVYVIMVCVIQFCLVFLYFIYVCFSQFYVVQFCCVYFIYLCVFQFGFIQSCVIQFCFVQLFFSLLFILVCLVLFYIEVCLQLVQLFVRLLLFVGLYFSFVLSRDMLFWFVLDCLVQLQLVLFLIQLGLFWLDLF